MAITPLQAVELIQKRVSQAGGVKTVYQQDSVGRVCRLYTSGFCCVKFSTGCLRVHKRFLRTSDKPAPACTSKCAKGC